MPAENASCYADSADVMKILLEKGINPNDRENVGSTHQTRVNELVEYFPKSQEIEL